MTNGNAIFHLNDIKNRFKSDMCADDNMSIDMAIELMQESNTIIMGGRGNGKTYSELVSLGKENAELKAEIERLKSELEQSVRLPCKTGDIIYTTNLSHTKIFKHRVSGFKVANKVTQLETYDTHSIDIYNLGTDLFLTREEAERAMKNKVTE